MKLFTPVLIIVPVALASAQVQPPATTGASRSAFFSSAEQKSHITAAKKRIAINTRKHDPFGLSQVPGQNIWKPPVRPGVPVRPSLFSQTIESLPVTAIWADKKKFVIGARIFEEGEVFPIGKGEEQVLVRVERVSVKSIDLVNVKGGERATRHLAIAPSGGIEPEKGSLPKGVYPDSEHPPILIP